jgi:hypothetical protein
MAKASSGKRTANVDGATLLVTLSGDWVARTNGVECGIGKAFAKPAVRALKFDTATLGH